MKLREVDWINILDVVNDLDKCIEKNSRPISLSCLGKVFERCMFKYIFNYLRNNELVSVNQVLYLEIALLINW